MIILILSIIGGVGLLLVGEMTTVHPHFSKFPPLNGERTTVYSSPAVFRLLIGAGIALLILGPLFTFIGCCLIQFQREARMRKAIAEESIQYSSRSPTPCSWRLETARNFLGEYGYHNHLVYQVSK